ncbi:MAG: hypothetical protein QOG88_1200 [Actinomycetota bacterium]|nr:hypothetical protein [Actinomycetota bacterium]
MKLILATIVVAFAIGLATGRSLAGFPSVSVGWGWLAVGGIALQLAPLSGESAFLALIASFIVLMAFAVLNLRVAGFLLILVGLGLNMLVIAANHGMPVTARALRDSGQASTVSELIAHGGAKHHLADTDTILSPLADVIAIPSPIGQAVSVGDICVHVGVAWFIVAAMQPERERRRRSVVT